MVADLRGVSGKRGQTNGIICVGLSGLLVLLCASPALAQLRIVTYNSTGGPRTDTDLILEGIGAESVGGIARPIDALLLQEQDSVSGDTQEFVDLLNAIYSPGGPAIYARSMVNGASSGGGTQTLVYNTQTIELISEATVGVIGGSTFARQALRYQLRPVGYDSSADFWVYNHHMKAGQTSTDADRRWRETQTTRQNADALNGGVDGAHVIYVGDFNIYSNLEKMWTNPGISPPSLTDAGNGQAFDPASKVGVWHDSSGYKIVHTQSPTTYERFAGQTTGGMDDRFDWQATTAEFLDGEGLSYISGSYHTFGNNGTHPLNGNIDDPSNTALPGLPNRTAVLTALATSSDHLPVVVDYQVPAKMQVAVGSIASRVLVGATANVGVTVTNSATAQVVAGADELDYSGGGSGAVSGSLSGTDQPLGGGNNHQLALSTATAGAKSGQINVTSTSQAVANGSFSQNVAYDVLDHANASLAGGSDVNTLTYDFGIVAKGTGTQTHGLALYNLIATPGATAALDLDSISLTGDSGVLSTDLTLFDNLAAGGAHVFNALLDTSSLGILATQVLMSLSDEDLPGEVTGQLLTLNLAARIALGGDANLDGYVEGADYTIWSDNYLQTGQSWQDGDFNGDGLVDGGDYTIWSDNYGLGPGPAAAAAVPEPSSLALAGLGALIGAALYRRQTKRPVS